MKNLNKLVYCAVFMALICVSTIAIAIPSPVTNGYLNLGDCFVLLAGWILGPFYGALSGGFGSALADILLSYAHYAPGTLIIKGTMALIAGLLTLHAGKRPFPARLIGGLTAEAVMVVGYFGYAALLLQKSWAAAASIPGNIAQGVVGIVAALGVVSILDSAKVIQKMKV